MTAPIEALLDSIQYEYIEKGDNISNDDGTLYAVKKGILDIEGYKLTVYVLNNGQRIFDANDFENFLTEKR
ncbi:hypothetical protein [Bacteroides neonati]|uniref:hypothetical protein n=1 Tax=Bacteroides neonati TaxID=1347393 RepID=UPI0004B09566|nr:hypothetical protein [Bacteroides neonati]